MDANQAFTFILILGWGQEKTGSIGGGIAILAAALESLDV